MPIISAFFGIVIRMFYQEHEPPHFHAEYQGQQSKFDLAGKLLIGSIRSRTALRLIEQWATLHRAELEANWPSRRTSLRLSTAAGTGSISRSTTTAPSSSISASGWRGLYSSR